jgi:hypothetical protein
VTTSHISSAEAEDVSRRVLCAIVDAVPEYARIAATRRPLLLAANRLNTRLYLSVLDSRRMPTVAESGCLSVTARERLSQGVSLPALSRACRVGARVLWQQVSTRAGLDPALLADLTMRYIDFASNAAETAYIAEREHLLNPSSARRQISFARLVDDDLEDASARLEALGTLGIGPGEPCIGVVVQAAEPAADTAGAGSGLGQAMAALRRLAPVVGSALTGRRAVALLAAASPAGLRDLLIPILAAASQGASLPGSRSAVVLTAGLGTPRTGDRAVAASTREAGQARLLGSVLAPEELVHSYDELRPFDFFTPGHRLDAFVRNVLADLLEYDRVHGSDLIRTLHGYVSAGQNRKAASRLLGIHPNTLDYRLRRAAVVTGADILSGSNAFRFEFALRLLPMCSPGLTRP